MCAFKFVYGSQGNVIPVSLHTTVKLANGYKNISLKKKNSFFVWILLGNEELSSKKPANNTLWCSNIYNEPVAYDGKLRFHSIDYDNCG